MCTFCACALLTLNLLARYVTRSSEDMSGSADSGVGGGDRATTGAASGTTASAGATAGAVSGAATVVVGAVTAGADAARASAAPAVFLVCFPEAEPLVLGLALVALDFEFWPPEVD